MCGIVGFTTYGIPDISGQMDTMLDRIKHRGPDECNSVIIENLAFGHVRLSIIDIKHGQQPMFSADGRYCIVFNGEVYNYLELRQHLVAKNVPLKTYSDTEVLLYMYAEYGEKCLNYLNGMFAFAIYDKAEKTLLLARDHFGIKPLYYYHDKNNFVFASEIKALLSFDSIKAIPNKESLFDYATFQLGLGEETMFKNIYKVAPASFLVFRNNKIEKIEKYWGIQYNIDDTISEDKYASELLVLLENSLSIQTRSDVPIGAYLSGGLDSSIVATLANKNHFKSLSTFTGGYEEGELFDETPYAKLLSDQIGSEHHVIFPTYKDFEENFQKLVYHMDEPCAGPGMFSQFMVSKLASEKVKVVLGGQGGDEIFGGYIRYTIAYLEQSLKGAIMSTNEEGKHVVTLSSIIRNLPLLKQYLPMLKKQFSTGLFDDMDKCYFRLIDRSPNLSSLYHNDFLNERNDVSIFNRYSDVFHSTDSVSFFNKMTHFDTKTLLPALLHVEDRVSMAVSIESRVPLLDKRIVELVAKMPPSIKFAGGKPKHILLEAVKNILPKEILERKDKMGFPTPINNWLAGPLKDFALDILTSQNAKNRGIIDSKKIEKNLGENSAFNRDIWGVLNMEMWHRTFIDA